MAKQTGPLNAVKKKQRALARPFGTSFGRALGFAAGFCLLAATAGCASNWHHPRKEGPEAAADERECAQRAEENALSRAGRQRADYRLGTPAPLPGMNRGESPMEMLDRRETQDDYGRDFESCMSSKGYSKE